MSNISKARRFAVVGSGCAGKTTVSKKIANRLNIKFIEIDAALYLPNWVERSREDLRRIIDAESAENSWVIDGNYRYLYDLTVKRADVILWLNFSFILVISRSLFRTIMRLIDGKDVFVGCKESFCKSFFTKHSIPWGVIKKWSKKRIQYRKIFDEKQFGDKVYIECRNQKELDEYVDTL